MPTIDLAWFRDTAEAKYGDLTIPIGDGAEVTLRNGLRLPKDERRSLSKLQKRLDNLQSDDEKVAKAEVLEGEDETDAMYRLMVEKLRLVADSSKGSDRLIAAIGDDLPALLEIFAKYGAASQPGEASPSAT